MYKKLQFIALIPNTFSDPQKYTLYLLARNEKTLLPVMIAKNEAVHLLRISPKIPEHIPSIHDTTKRIILGLNAKLTSILIYKHDNDIYYAYLNLIFKERKIQINTAFSDALNLSKRFDAPLYIEEEILSNHGIKITKQILRDALNEEY